MVMGGAKGKGEVGEEEGGEKFLFSFQEQAPRRSSAAVCSDLPPPLSLARNVLLAVVNRDSCRSLMASASRTWVHSFVATMSPMLS